MNCRNLGLLTALWCCSALLSETHGQGPAGTAPQGQPAAPQRAAPLAQPAWYPLPPQHQQYLDEVLAYWEFQCRNLNRYQCSFTHFVYAPNQHNIRQQDGEYPANEIHEGVIKYLEPDKALYRVEKVWSFDPQVENQYQTLDPQRFGNHWICDGASVFDFDYTERVLHQHELPPEARGQAIDRGPMPFLFKARVDDLKRRFWMRVVTPPNVQGEYWIEAVPKSQADAAYFQFAHLIVDEEKYLPKALVMFDPAFDPRNNPKKQTYIFDDRRVNWQWQDALNGLNIFSREFYEPRLESGWRKVVHPANAPAGNVTQNPPPGQPR